MIAMTVMSVIMTISMTTVLIIVTIVLATILITTNNNHKAIIEQNCTGLPVNARYLLGIS